jgi:hypothetical protein
MCLASSLTLSRGWLAAPFGRRLVFYVALIVHLVGVLLIAKSGLAKKNPQAEYVFGVPE